MNVTLSEKAADMISTTIEAQNLDNAYLAFYVSGGGCSGLQYGLALADGEPEIDDIIVYDKNIKIAIDNKSAKFVSGSIIDFQETSMGGGFKIENPNEKNGCGCGKSFAVEQNEMPEYSSCNSCSKY